jgi:hypothetical protein
LIVYSAWKTFFFVFQAKKAEKCSSLFSRDPLMGLVLQDEKK